MDAGDSKKNKKPNQSDIFQVILLFIGAFAIIFIGFVLCNILAIAIDCLFIGFESLQLNCLNCHICYIFYFLLLFHLSLRC